MPQPARQRQGCFNRLIVVVGHGPSILSGLGSVIDSFPVVRLKRGLSTETGEPKRDPVHWGKRTDYLCARSNVYDLGQAPFWHYTGPAEKRWDRYYGQFSDRKPSTGLCAVFCAIDRLEPKSVGLIGFDRLLNPHRQTCKWWEETERLWPAHDMFAELSCLLSLGLSIVNLPEVYGEASRLRSAARP